MEFQVAVASLDGILINQHFGKNREFLIYRIQENGEYDLVERRELKAPCGQGEHHEDALVRSAKELQDCSFVLVARIGAGAEKVLASHGIKVFETYDRIDRALDKLIKYLNGTTKR